jgi:hypothetical protein
MIDAYNKNSTVPEEKKINLQGWAVGNGCTDPAECVGRDMFFKNDGSSYFFDFMFNQGKSFNSFYKKKIDFFFFYIKL